jgi:aspartate/methionine/tyrosine aminotransferase
VKYYAKHNIELDEDQIIVTTAGSEAITFAMMLTCNEGDEIIVPEPFYTNYNALRQWLPSSSNPSQPMLRLALRSRKM